MLRLSHDDFQPNELIRFIGDRRQLSVHVRGGKVLVARGWMRGWRRGCSWRCVSGWVLCALNEEVDHDVGNC
jgi:hypothetical protein